MDQPARAAVDQRQDGRDRGVRRRAKRERLDQGDPEREPRLCILGEPLLRRAVDECVEIGQAAKRLGRDGISEGAVFGSGDIARGRIERGFERQSAAQRRIEQPQRRAARGRSWRIGGNQARRPSGSRALARAKAERCGGPPISAAIAWSAAMRLPVAGWVENRLSPPSKPGTI